MVEFTARAHSAAEQWSSDREVSLTEELDAHLRSHRCARMRAHVCVWGGGISWMDSCELISIFERMCRPRAGRIEEETRLARSVELISQRRKVENHLRLQSRAVKVRVWYEEGH